MHLIFPSPKREAALAATSISATNRLIHQPRPAVNRLTTAPSTPPATSYVTSWPLRPSPKLVPSSSTAKRPSRSAMPSKNSAILNRPRPYKPTTQPPPATPTTPSSKNARKPWTCVYLGYNAVNGNDNPSSTGDQAVRTSAIIIPSITLPVTIKQ